MMEGAITGGQFIHNCEMPGDGQMDKMCLFIYPFFNLFD